MHVRQPRTGIHHRNGGRMYGFYALASINTGGSSEQLANS